MPDNATTISREAQYRKQVDDSQREVSLSERVFAMIQKENLPENDEAFLKVQSDLADKRTRLERAKKQLNDYLASEQINTVGAPFRDALNAALKRVPEQQAALLDDVTVSVQDVAGQRAKLEEDRAKLTARLALLGAIDKVAEQSKVDPEVLKSFPGITITWMGNRAEAKFAEPKRSATRKAKGEGGGTRTTLGAFRITKSDNPNHVGKIVGSGGDLYPSWQKFYDAEATDEIKSQYEGQSRNKRPIMLKLFNIEGEEINNTATTAEASAA